MAKSTKARRAPASRLSAKELAREQTRRALRRAHQREKEIVQLTKRVERATAAADRALADLGSLILDRDAERSTERMENEATHAGAGR
jgi:glycine cleavage system protein P-like pyridoxal-binding family